MLKDRPETRTEHIFDNGLQAAKWLNSLLLPSKIANSVFFLILKHKRDKGEYKFTPNMYRYCYIRGKY